MYKKIMVIIGILTVVIASIFILYNGGDTEQNNNKQSNDHDATNYDDSVWLKVAVQGENGDKITINDIMKLIIICKDENKEIDNNNKNLKVVCGLCGGEDTRTTIKIILEEYGDEITEIVSPKCDIIKNLME